MYPNMKHPRGGGLSASLLFVFYYLKSLNVESQIQDPLSLPLPLQCASHFPRAESDVTNHTIPALVRCEDASGLKDFAFNLHGDFGLRGN